MSNDNNNGSTAGKWKTTAMVKGYCDVITDHAERRKWAIRCGSEESGAGNAEPNKKLQMKDINSQDDSGVMRFHTTAVAKQ